VESYTYVLVYISNIQKAYKTIYCNFHTYNNSESYAGSLRRISHAVVSISQPCGLLRWINIIAKCNCLHSHGRLNVNITTQHRISVQWSLSRTASGRCVFQNSATSSATFADVLHGLLLSLEANVGLITRLTPRPLPPNSIPIYHSLFSPIFDAMESSSYNSGCNAC